MTRLYHNKDWLQQKYVVEGLTLAKIAKIAGTCHAIISKWLKMFGIKMRSRSEALSGERNPLFCKRPEKAIAASIVARTGVPLSEEHRKKQSEALRGDKSHLWRGGKPKNYAGRSMMYDENREYVFVARLNAERALQRKLKPSEVIHHIDENKSNDDLSNLFLFRHLAAHTRWHLFLRRHKLDGKILQSNLQAV